DDHLTVDGQSKEHVKGDINLTVDTSLHIKQGKKQLLEAGTEIHHKAGDKVIIEAGTEITVKTAAGFVKLDPAGVHISGPVVNLNSGGSAGSGSGFGGVMPAMPLLLNDVDPLQLTTQLNEKEEHALESKFALTQLNGLPKVFDEHRFSMWLSGVFGHDIPPQAYLDFYKAVQSGSITNPPIEVVVGSVAYYNNKTQTIIIGKNFIRNAKEETGKDHKARLLTVLVHEFGHHIDYLLRNVYSTVGGDASLDEGAAFAVLLSNINMRKKTETVVANYKGIWGDELLSITYANVHKELQNQRSHIENDKKSQDGDREYFSAGGTAEQAKHGKYGHRSIELALVGIFGDDEIDTIYYGNWLRDYSQVVDIKLLEFNLDLLIGAADEQINGLDTIKKDLPAYLNKVQSETELIRTQAVAQLEKAKLNLARFKNATSEQMFRMSSELSGYRSALNAQIHALTASQTELNTILNQRSLPTSSANQVKQSIDNIDSAIGAKRTQLGLLDELDAFVLGGGQIVSLSSQNAERQLSSVQRIVTDADIDRFFSHVHQSLPAIDQYLTQIQEALKQCSALLKKVADIEMTDNTGITSGGRRVGSKAISRESLTQVVEILARKEFPDRFAESDNSPFRLNPEKLGVYRPEEHLDNPKGITAPANPQYTGAFRGNYKDSEGEIDANKWYKNFFKDSITFAKEQLSLAADAGRNAKGLIHFGQALHVMEDIYAHSNFVELAINRLHQEGKVLLLKPVNTWVQPVQVSKTDSQEVEPLTTGIFGASDTVVSLLSVLEKGSDHSTSAEKQHYQTQVSIMLVLLNDYKPNAVALLFDALGLDYSSTSKSLSAEQALEAAQKADEVSYLYRWMVKEFLNLLFLFSNQLKALIARQMMEAIKYAQDDTSPTDPTHTQLAKDPDDHPLHTIAAETAQRMVETMGEAMRDVWRGEISSESLLTKADSFFIHPEKINNDSPEHIQRLYEEIHIWARKNPFKLRMAAEYDGHLEHELEKLKMIAESSTEVIDWYVALEKLVSN
ncbi:hypothetical protein RN22_23895, partial [Grimontia sp. AD028]|uniref:HET-C-related protein n=1 Tax=Grimontia sp. AD028 TaxID=1581149 RepID=UPI00061AEF7D